MTPSLSSKHGAFRGWLAAAIIWIVVAAALAFGPPRGPQDIRLAETRTCP